MDTRKHVRVFGISFKEMNFFKTDRANMPVLETETQVPPNSDPFVSR